MVEVTGLVLPSRPVGALAGCRLPAACGLAGGRRRPAPADARRNMGSVDPVIDVVAVAAAFSRERSNTMCLPVRCDVGASLPRPRLLEARGSRRGALLVAESGQPGVQRRNRTALVAPRPCSRSARSDRPPGRARADGSATGAPSGLFTPHRGDLAGDKRPRRTIRSRLTGTNGLECLPNGDAATACTAVHGDLERPRTLRVTAARRDPSAVRRPVRRLPGRPPLDVEGPAPTFVSSVPSADTMTRCRFPRVPV